MSCASVKVWMGHGGSRQRQIRTNHLTKVTRAKHGASCSTRRPWPTANPTGRAGGLQLTRLDAEHQPLLVIDLHIEHVHVGNIEDGISSGTNAHPNHT
jgi:hypothetical protein